MSEREVTLTIEGVEVTVPRGTLLVNAAKQAGVHIPVFCYHPKLDPVGMCRMCLVEIGRPRRDRETGEFIRDEQGQPVIDFGPRLETACTTPVDEGWVVRVTSPKALQGQKEIVEFLLTSHPLDCPICDKGGECPLQELTMDFGSGKSRFLYDDKMHLAKHVPLGDLIVLDRERCIQCARCTRFQEEVVDDPVIGFEQRGRALQIVTYSDPGFDSYFSGNTTDICPVGALTTVDFRFEARPWELKAAASLCPHCPVGCNTVLNTRRQPQAGGRITVQRVMPRQNESVNEIWLCDKGRFAHHYAGSPERLARPLVRGEGGLAETDWETALQRAAEGLKAAEGAVVGLASGRVSNEDLYNFRRLVEALGGRVYLDDAMGGGEVVQQVGVGAGTNLGCLGEGDAILVYASDLHEEAPIWWLRVKRAVDRGATLVVANARPTRLDKYARHILRYDYPEAVHKALALTLAVTGGEELKAYADEAVHPAAEALKGARNLVVFYGCEGLDVADSEALARALGNLLAGSGHAGRPDNGLIPVWPRANTQGAWDMGLRPPEAGLSAALEGARAVYVLAADPLGDDPALAEALQAAEFVVVQELFRTPTTEAAHVVFPAQSFIEREGTFTSGERRVQRFYPATPPWGETRPDWQILAQVGARLGLDLEARSPAIVFRQIAEAVPDYASLDYPALARIELQWPPVGGDDLYFGGTAYKNDQGVGVPLAPAAQRGEPVAIGWGEPPAAPQGDGLLLVPVAALYDHGRTVTASDILRPRLVRPRLRLHPEDAHRLGLESDASARVAWDGREATLEVEVSPAVPTGAGLVPRSGGLALWGPVVAQVARGG